MHDPYDEPVKSEPFVSYAENAEDVVLQRALGSVPAGRYVEVGADHSSDHCVTRAFSDRGWNGIVVEPTRRLDDVLTESGWADQEIHFLVIDVEGDERDILQSVDLGRWRPWVLVVRSTVSTSSVTTYRDWEPELVTAGYEFCLFDGLSRFYVATEKADDLRTALSYPACMRDDYQTLSDTIAMRERQDLLKQTEHWRTIALTHWADAVSHAVVLPRDAGHSAELDDARKELVAIRGTLSWRITRPLRGVRRLIDRARRGR